MVHDEDQVHALLARVSSLDKDMKLLKYMARARRGPSKIPSQFFSKIYLTWRSEVGHAHVVLCSNCAHIIYHSTRVSFDACQVSYLFIYLFICLCGSIRLSTTACPIFPFFTELWQFCRRKGKNKVYCIVVKLREETKWSWSSSYNSDTYKLRSQTNTPVCHETDHIRTFFFFFLFLAIS